jgi:hypothetical protein
VGKQVMHSIPSSLTIYATSIPIAPSLGKTNLDAQAKTIGVRESPDNSLAGSDNYCYFFFLLIVISLKI